MRKSRRTPTAALLCLSLTAATWGCSSTPTATPPAPSATATSATVPSATVPSATVSSATAPSATAADVTSAPEVAPPPATAPTKAPKPTTTVELSLEQPYLYGRRAEPKTKAEYLEDIRTRRRWNDGGLGKLSEAQPGPDGHPDPRVVVNIDKVKGGHTASTLQRVARRYHWMKVVRCYRLGAHKDQTLRGWTEARIEVSRSGKVKSARMLSTDLKDDAVARCMASKLTKLKFPTAKGGTSAWVRMRVGPGDEPQPPPTDVLDAGSGTLAAEDMRAGTREGFDAFERCYREAFSYAPQLWGRIVIRFHIDRRGKVDEAFQGESRFADKRTLHCVLKAARKLRFPTPSGGDVRFEVPVRFHSSAAADADSDD